MCPRLACPSLPSRPHLFARAQCSLSLSLSLPTLYFYHTYTIYSCTRARCLGSPRARLLHGVILITATLYGLTRRQASDGKI
ncbi:hypothetical protein DAEQUDRAFT_30395 [Daedalea quercina L-15889]|uniref:Uncharacterized protein n=1 Tax=Daedalea quercina L-15889 TaxID=1314783 RepID=A0A165SPY7_9APHY|nr:hypothetical protein DAEQUDRAFT_30395 [Daedalea quercina L-15889]